MKLNIDSKTILYFILIVVAACGFSFTFFLSHPLGFYAFIVVASMVGFAISLNIYDTKSRGKQLVCPTGSNCNTVITSRYAKFLGVSLEYWGMGYFFIITLSYLALIIASILFTPNMKFMLVLLSTAAGFFSAYLLFVQAFLLRAWCIWCILTAFLSLTICVTSLAGVTSVVEFLVSIENVLHMVKFLGFAFGLGGATASAFLLKRFLDDAKIDERELDVIKDLSEIVWVGFGLVLVSQLAIFISNPAIMGASSAFLVQIFALFVFAFAGALLMVIYAPFLVFMPFKKMKKGERGEAFVRLRRPTFIIGTLAVCMWYVAFVMNFVERMPLYPLLAVFLILIVSVAAFAVMWDKKINSN